jgi:hypothetical protein
VSQFALTFQQLKDEATQAMGGAPDSRTPVDRLVNGALEYFCGIHPWSWRVTITTLSIVSGAGRILLPADFGELVDLVGSTAAAMTAIVPRPWPQVMRARVAGIGGNNCFIYHVGLDVQTDVTAVPRRCLELGPLPSASVADALFLTYRRCVPVLAGATDVPAIPYGMHGLLRTLVRAMAVSNTVQQAGHDWELFNQQLVNYAASDGKAEGQVGQLSNALLDDGGVYPLAPHNSILLPGEAGY